MSLSYYLNIFNFFNRPGAFLQPPQSFIDSFIDWLSDSLVKICSEHSQSQTRRARELKFWNNVFLHYLSCVMWPVSCVIRHMSHVTCHLSHVNIFIFTFLADPGKARGCSTNTSVTHSVSDPLVPTAQRRRHGQSAKMIKLARSVIVNFLETLPSSFVKGLWCFFF